MNGSAFEEKLSIVLPKFENNIIIIMCNVPYHSRRFEKIPTNPTTKADIQDWLRSKYINFVKNCFKVKLLSISKPVKMYTITTLWMKWLKGKTKSIATFTVALRVEPD